MMRGANPEGLLLLTTGAHLDDSAKLLHGYAYAQADTAEVWAAAEIVLHSIRTSSRGVPVCWKPL
jgi:hypothetical protein